MTIVQTKQCAHCQSSFDITQDDLDFYAKISPTFGDYIAQVPTPTLCPACRQRRRLAFRNERYLYRRTCDASGKDIISIYSPDKSYIIYDQKIRRSDDRDPLDYGREFDFSLTFTEQFDDLMREVPRLALFSQRSEGSFFTNQSYDNKNCYMSFAIGDSEDLLYCTYVTHSQSSIDLTYSHHCANSCHSTNCDRCYHIEHCFFLKDCRDCMYCVDCIGCDNLIGCSGLRNASYCIENIQYSKEEFEKRKQTTTISSLPAVEIETNLHSDSSTGVFLYNAKDSRNCSDVFDVEACAHSKWIFDSRDCYDCYGMGGAHMMCEGIGVENIAHSFADTVVSDGSYVYYSDLCMGSSHIFGCIGLRNKSYCIFNRQYTKEQYNELVPKIIEHMKQTGERGEFFHPSLSPFGYNETVVQEHFPAKKGVLGHLGYKRSDYESPAPQVEKIIPGEKLPVQGCMTIYQKQPTFLDDILRYAIRCQDSGKLFRLIPQEVAFYRKHNLPLPRKHPDVRHAERMALRK